MLILTGLQMNVCGRVEQKTGTSGAPSPAGCSVDRLMLSQIVERWGGLSEDLKRAVLAVVGSGRFR
tara:strand:+ start:129 stop:326 length:198 start_codon:yes stop_codon:yes gene_type:complete